MRRRRIVGPLVWARPIPASLGRNHEAVWIREECFRNQLLAHVGSVRIRSVNKIHAKLDRSAQHRFGLSAIFGRSPDALSCKTHRAESEAMNGNFSAECETP